jgi:hypothetical protein
VGSGQWLGTGFIGFSPGGTVALLPVALATG